MGAPPTVLSLPDAQVITVELCRQVIGFNNYWARIMALAR